MGFKVDYVKEINDLLMEKRDENDIQATLNIPEHKFKKISKKFNYVLRMVYERHAEKELKMFHILLSLQNYFDMQMLVKDVLNAQNKALVIDEMQKEYNMKLPPKEKKVKKNGKTKKKKGRRKKD
jgi:hypothetical protein